MSDPNFEKPSKPGPQLFGSLDGNPPGASVPVQAGLGQQLGQVPSSLLNQDTAELRRFVTKEYQILSIDLSVVRANVLQSFSRQLSFIWIPNSTNTTDLLQIRIDSATADPIPFLPGTKLNGLPFERLYLTNAAIAGATMSVMVAENWPVDQLDTDA